MESKENILLENVNGIFNKTSGNFSEPETKGMYIPLYIYIIVSILNVVIFLVGIFGNLLVIIVVLKVRYMRTTTNVFLFNLSIADILVLLVCQPAGLLEFFGKDRWFLGGVMCKMVPFMENNVLHVSILTIVAVTLERFNALCRPLKGKMPYTVKSTIKTITGIWVIASIISVPFIIMTSHEDARFYDGSLIKVCRTKVDQPWRYVYTIMIFLVFFVLPFLLLVAIYLKIIKQLTSKTLRSMTRNNHSAGNILRSRKQVVKMLILIMILFFVSLFPIRAITLWLVFTPSEYVTKIGLESFLNLMAWARILMYVNSAGNPIIYSLTSPKFKRAFKGVLRRHFFNTADGTVLTRYKFNKNVARPAAEPYKCSEEDVRESYRREPHPRVVIKLVLTPPYERVHGVYKGSTEEQQFVLN